MKVKEKDINNQNLKKVIQAIYGKIARGQSTVCCPSCGPTKAIIAIKNRIVRIHRLRTPCWPAATKLIGDPYEFCTRLIYMPYLQKLPH